MKEQLIANLKRVNWEFEDRGDSIVIKDFFNLHVIVFFFGASSYKMDNKLKGWNPMSGYMEYSLKKATNINYWSYVIAALIWMIYGLLDGWKPLIIGTALLLTVTFIGQSAFNLIYWSRYNTISTQIEAWLRPV